MNLQLKHLRVTVLALSLVVGMGVCGSAVGCLQPGAKNRCVDDDDCLVWRVCVDTVCQDEDDLCVGCEDGGEVPSPSVEPSPAPSPEPTVPEPTVPEPQTCSSFADCDNGESCNVDVCMRVSTQHPTLFACDDAHRCPGTQACLNGHCATTCSANTDCDAGTYCVTSEGLCAPTRVIECGADDCDDGLACVDGLCVVAGATSCAVDADCDRWEVCARTSSTDAVCVAPPACDRSAACGDSVLGAVCNAGLVDDKARMCLLGWCRGDVDCGDSARCLQQPDGLGRCTRHRPLDWCLSDADCDGGCERGATDDVFGRCAVP